MTDQKQDILTQWEADAKEEVRQESETGEDYNNYWSLLDNQRILALVELVRKKDEALESIKERTTTDPAGSRRTSCSCWNGLL